VHIFSIVSDYALYSYSHKTAEMADTSPASLRLASESNVDKRCTIALIKDKMYCSEVHVGYVYKYAYQNDIGDEKSAYF
jgi:hypothetical protein